MPYLKKWLACLIISLSLFFLNINYVQAQILPECAATGRCTICDMIQTAINIGSFLLGIVGALALLFFVYGGLVMIFSAGKEAWITKGKEILINSTIGVAIVFLAYTGVSTIVAVVTGGGWDWENNLQCAPLPEEVPMISECGLGGCPTEGTKAEGESCAASNECQETLFCNKERKCQKKLVTDAKCENLSIESIGATGTNLFKADNLACASNLCSYPPTSGDVPDTNLIKICKKPAAGQGTIKQGGECTHNNDCATGLYCQIQAAGANKGTCAKLSTLGQFCDSKSVLRGNADDMCETGRCDTLANIYKCIAKPSARVGVGQFCTRFDQCTTGSCKCEGDDTQSRSGEPSCLTGLCAEKIPRGNTTRYCDQWEASRTAKDGNRCESNLCDDRLLVGTGKCDF